VTAWDEFFWKVLNNGKSIWYLEFGMYGSLKVVGKSEGRMLFEDLDVNGSSIIKEIF
jgi:hypothetical protein